MKTLNKICIITMSSQSWHKTLSPECCYHDGCSDSGQYRYIVSNDALCEKHYNERRQDELQEEYDTDGFLTARPELKKNRSERLLNENILNSLLPSEGGQINGKDWIEELHETNV